MVFLYQPLVRWHAHSLHPSFPAKHNATSDKYQLERVIKSLRPDWYVFPDSRIICLLLALQWGVAKYPGDNARIIALFIVFGVMMVVFIGVEFWQKESTTILLRILKDRNILGAVWFGFRIGGALFIFTYYVSYILLPSVHSY